MTTIAWDGEELAADTLESCGSALAGYGQKIFREKGLLIGGAGSKACFERFRDWIRGGLDGPCPLQKDIGNMFVIEPDGQTTMWCDDGPFKVSTGKWALGSGECYAVGAMEMGATAEEAVRVASRHDLKTGGEITVLRPEI